MRKDGESEACTPANYTTDCETSCSSKRRRSPACPEPVIFRLGTLVEDVDMHVAAVSCIPQMFAMLRQNEDESVSRVDIVTYNAWEDPNVLSDEAMRAVHCCIEQRPRASNVRLIRDAPSCTENDSCTLVVAYDDTHEIDCFRIPVCINEKNAVDVVQHCGALHAWPTSSQMVDTTISMVWCIGCMSDGCVMIQLWNHARFGNKPIERALHGPDIVSKPKMLYESVDGVRTSVSQMELLMLIQDRARPGVSRASITFVEVQMKNVRYKTVPMTGRDDVITDAYMPTECAAGVSVRSGPRHVVRMYRRSDKGNSWLVCCEIPLAGHLRKEPLHIAPGSQWSFTFMCNAGSPARVALRSLCSSDLCILGATDGSDDVCPTDGTAVSDSCLHMGHFILYSISSTGSCVHRHTYSPTCTRKSHGIMDYCERPARVRLRFCSRCDSC